MKALRGKRKDSGQKSHTAPPVFLLATSTLGHSHKIPRHSKTPQSQKEVKHDGRFYLDMEFTNGTYYLVDIRVLPTIMSGLVTGLLSGGIHKAISGNGVAGDGLHKYNKCYRVQKLKGNGL